MKLLLFSLGFGAIKLDIKEYKNKVLSLGVLYFLSNAAMGFFEANEEENWIALMVVELSFLECIFFCWTFFAINQTISQMEHCKKIINIKV